MIYDTREIKNRLTIPQAWKMLKLPGEPALSCCSPLRPDKNPSFSVYDSGRKWKDHSTGDGGDVIDFVTLASGLGKKEGIIESAKMAGLRGEDGAKQQSSRRAASTYKPKGPTLKQIIAQREKEEQRHAWPPLRALTDDEIETICRLRHVRRRAVESLVECGRLWAAKYYGVSTYAFSSPKFLQLRRLDGQEWIIEGEKRKTQNPKGCEGSWVTTGSDFGDPSHPVIITEGPISTLEMIEVLMRAEDISGRIQRCTLIAAVGAGRHISSELLHAMAGRRVRIIADNDSDKKAGVIGAARWAGYLTAAGCHLDTFRTPDQFKDIGEMLGPVSPQDPFWTKVITF